MPIRVLPRQLVDQIAAGEVVERPANAVKELVENALDAGATRVQVDIEGGGADLILVSDDGAGIPAEELPLAVTSHATSKIASVEDLTHVTTLGFRGEALASIASVSRLTLTSRAQGADAAWSVAVEGGVVQPPRPAARAAGTAVEVRQLFFNVPARRRFLRSVAAESGRVLEVLEAVAVGRPGVAFQLVADGKVKLDLPATDDPRQRAMDILGRTLEPQMLAVTGEAQVEGGSPVAVWGLVGQPAVAKATGRALRLVLNGRAVQDRTMLHAVKEAFRGLVDPGRSPVGYLAVVMDPALVDVNVHPAKTEVRFRQPSFVHQLVYRAVLDTLRAADLVPEWRNSCQARVSLLSEGTDRCRAGPGDGVGAGAGIGAGAGVSLEAGAGAGADADLGACTSASADAIPSARSTIEPKDTPSLAMPGWRPSVVVVAPEPENPGHPCLAPISRRVLQVHGSYLVVEDAQGLLIVDQHALHERAMYEELYHRVTAGPLESQRMLTPQIIPVDPRAAELLEELAPLLQRLGIEAVAAGPRSIAVHAYPTFLQSRRVDPGAFLPALLERAADEGIPTNTEAALHTVLDMMACKAAVKAGDHLNATEIEALLDLRERIERSTACPHGRPTALRITIRDLERQFGRV
ncbi:MAG: DNA mismatch repair endonuclease MutL [Phycisphaerales bacterium]